MGGELVAWLIDNNVFTFLGVFSIGIMIISGLIVYSNESKEIQNKPILKEILGGIDIFFTSRYLNKKGKKWRPYFLLSIFYILIWFVFL